MEKFESRFLSYESIASEEKKFKRYTGIAKKVIDALFCSNIYPSLPQYCNLSSKDQFLPTLVKLRLNIPFENLSDQFNCTSSSIVGIWTAATYQQDLLNPAIQVQ